MIYDKALSNLDITNLYSNDGIFLIGCSEDERKYPLENLWDG